MNSRLKDDSKLIIQYSVENPKTDSSNNLNNLKNKPVNKSDTGNKVIGEDSEAKAMNKMMLR